MSNAIVNVVVGYPIPRGVESFFNEYEIDPDKAGFKTFYHGNATVQPAYAGVAIGKFSECNNLSRAEVIHLLTPKDGQFAQARQHMAEAREAFADCLGEQLSLSADDRQELLASLPDEPDVHLVWSTS